MGVSLGIQHAITHSVGVFICEDVGYEAVNWTRINLNVERKDSVSHEAFSSSFVLRALSGDLAPLSSKVPTSNQINCRGFECKSVSKDLAFNAQSSALAQSNVKWGGRDLGDELNGLSTTILSIPLLDDILTVYECLDNFSIDSCHETHWGWSVFC